jgi:hypothetical protein
MVIRVVDRTDSERLAAAFPESRERRRTGIRLASLCRSAAS